MKKEKKGYIKKIPFLKNKWFKVFLCVIIIFIVFFSISYILIYNAFNPTEAADLPCRNLDNTSISVNVSGFQLWYKENGTDTGNPPIVILHGGPGMSSYYFQNCFNFLEEDYQVIYYDQRGSGYSQIKPDLTHYTFEKLVIELETIRKEIIQKEKIILIGHSYGGLISMKYAMDYEEHLDKMILISSVPPKHKSEGFDLGLIINHGLPPSNPEEANAWFINAIPNMFRDSFYNKDDINLLKSGYASFATMIAVSNSIKDYDLTNSLTKLDVETLILYGIVEPSSTPEEGQIEINDLLTNSSLYKFNNSGHWCFLEEPDVFKEKITSFLKET